MLQKAEASSDHSLTKQCINQALSNPLKSQAIHPDLCSNNNTKSKPAIHQSIHQSIHTWIVWELVFNYTPSPHPQKKWNRKKTRGLEGVLIVFNPRWVLGSVFPNFFLVQVDAFAISKIIPHTSKHLLIRDWLGIPRIVEQQSDPQQFNCWFVRFWKQTRLTTFPRKAKTSPKSQKNKTNYRHLCWVIQSHSKINQTFNYHGSKTHFTSLKNHINIHLMI